MRKISVLIVGGLITTCISLLPLTVSAQTTNTNATSGKERLGFRDQRFLHEAAEGNLAEQQMGQLAQKSTNPQVKALGQKLTQDHAAANQQLMQIAQAQGVTLPTELDKHHSREIQKLGELSGSDFDQKFVNHAVKDHETDIRRYERESEHAENPQLRQYASSTLPVLRSHLSQAQALSSQAGAGKSMQEPSGAGATKTNRNY